MKILNKTSYLTKDISQILNWCLKKEGMVGKNLVVEIIETRRVYDSHRDFVGGYAYYGEGDFNQRNYIMLKLAKRGTFKAFDLAHTFIHELAHTRGVKHSEMGIFPEENDVPDMEIRKKSIPQKKDFRILRYENAIKKSKEYERKMKRTQNLMRKWQKKVKYYQKRMGDKNENEHRD